MKNILLSALASVGCIAASAQISPNGKFKVEADGPQGISVAIAAAEGYAGLMRISGAVESAEVDSGVCDVRYSMPTGKRRECVNAYRAGRYRMASGDTLHVRVYNDGIAWKRSQSSTVVDISPARNRWMQRWTNCYEGFFPVNEETHAGERFGYPALFEFGGDVFALLAESGMSRDCAAASMYATPVSGVFEIRPDGPGDSGWQTLIAGSLADVVESTLVTDNSAPCCLSDTSWIKPGVASWVYWAYNHGSNDYGIIKRYVDLAAELSLPYVLIDAEWDEMKDGRTVEDAVAYALSKGVRPMIWYNSSVGWLDGAPGPKFRLNNPEDREREFEWCRRIGVAGVKIDFFSGDNNKNIRYMHELMESAAAHGLLVNFHGATIPRGWQRTYPNLVTTEAVYGAEWYNNVPTFTDKAARHNAMLPFTRNVIGSMDYTPCAFSDSQHPHITTHAHELALTVLYESGVQHIADRPESILAQPAEVRGFFTALPAAWDETRLLGGYPGEYAVIARRSGDCWYIAGINGTDSPLENLKIDLSVLPADVAARAATVFADGDTAGTWRISHAPAVPSSVSLLPRGGFVAVAGPVR